MKCAIPACTGTTKTVETVPDNTLPAIFRRLVCKECGNARVSFEIYVEDPDYVIPRGVRTNRRKPIQPILPEEVTQLSLPNLEPAQEETDANTTSAGDGESSDSPGGPAPDVQGQ